MTALTTTPTTSAFSAVSRSRKVKNNLAAVLVTAAFLLALLPLAWILVTVVSRGFDALTSAAWWSRSQRGILPDQFGGGVYHALYGTVVQALMATLIAIPIGLFAAIYLVEYGRGRLRQVTTFMVDILSGVPSIVAALFVFALWISALGQEQSGFAVSLALVMLMLPVIIRSTEEMLRLVPDELREASLALGVPKWVTIVRVVLPTAASGLISGILLAIARVMGETAPVLVLVGYSSSINYDVFSGNMASLPLQIYAQLTNPTPAGQQRVWGAALTLILVVAVLAVVAAGVSRALAVRRR